MKCTQCGQEYQPAVCEACGSLLGGGRCPACAGTVSVCPSCGRPVAAQQAASSGGEAPGAPVYGQPQQTPPPQPGQQTAPPPPPAGAPYPNMPPMGGPGSIYQGRPIPTKKVPLGGWLMFFFVLTCIGLAWQLVSLLMSLTGSSFSIVSLGINLVFSILPSVMIVFFILQRDIKFKYWYYFSAIVGILTSLLGIFGMAVLGAAMTQDPALMETVMATAGYGGLNFPPSLMGIVSIISIVVFGISIVVQILWWVYFNKSRRVAYTFDPRNNPPR